MSCSHHSILRAQAAASSAPIDPNFPEPSAAPRSQLDKVADVLTTLFPVWVRLHKLSRLRSFTSNWTCMHAQCSVNPCLLPIMLSPATKQRLMQVCLGAAIGISRPESVAWCSSGLFTGLLGFLMLSMGLTLTFDDFKKVSPHLCQLQAAQYTYLAAIMPSVYVAYTCLGQLVETQRLSQLITEQPQTGKQFCG